MINSPRSDSSRVEIEARQSVERFRFFADAMPHIVWTSTPDGNLDYYNQRWFDYTGMTLEQTQGWGWKPVLHPDDLQNCVDRWTQAYQTGEPYHVEYRFKRASDGQYRWHLGRALPMKNDCGDVLMWVGTCTDIDDYKKAEEALRHAQAELECRVEERTADLIREQQFTNAVLDSMNAAVFACDEAGQLIVRNRAANLYSNVGKKETHPTSWADDYGTHFPNGGGLMSMEDIPLYRALQGETISNLELLLIPSTDAPSRSVLVSGQPMVDNLGRKSGAVVVCYDITDRKETEEALLQSEERFRQAFTSAPIGMALVSPDGKWLRVNQSMCDIVGYTPDELMALDFQTITYPDDLELDLDFVRQMLAGDIQHYDMEKRYFHKSGKAVWVLLSVSLVRDSQDRPIHFIAQIQDIMQRKQMEHDLIESKFFAESIANGSTTIIYIIDLEKKSFIYANQYAADFIGRSVHDMLNDTQTLMRETVHPNDRAFASKHFENFARLDDDAVIEFEQRLRGRHGEWRWVWHRERVFRRDSDGNPCQILGTGLDITDRKQAEQDLAGQAIELKRSNEEMEQFASMASHDLQEPLRKIQAFGSRLTQKYGSALDESGLDYLNRMTDAADRMQNLIKDLLDLARVTSQARPFTNIDLTCVAREALADLDDYIADSHATVVIDKLPEIVADGMQIRQLIQNLISNALKYNQQVPPPNIRITGRVSRGEVHIDVSDNGIGFDMDYAEKIFQPFQRLHGREEYKGTGMGLAICRKIVERHRGTITAVSALGEGSTFHIVLPIRQLETARIPEPKLIGETSRETRRNL